ERAFTCLCGATGCRGEVRPEDLEDQAPRWDERVRAVLPEVLEVLQPLWDQLADPAQVQRVARGPDQLLTLATLRYKAFVKDVAAGARK
ncbi:MAG: hypothetical protein KC933_41665, partial [Myxococcales bacterium]|nr:hypothetical protein [Myxococcales bacterium]